MGITFERDVRKARRNARKHGVTFEEAATSFDDPLGITIQDPEHAEGEMRYLHLGLSPAG